MPEALHEASKVQGVVVVRLEQLFVDLRHEELKLVLIEHRVVHIVLSVHLHQICNRNDFLAQGSIARVLLLVEV